MIRKNIRLLNQDLQVLYQCIEFNKEFKTKKIHIGFYKTTNLRLKNNLSTKSRQIKIFYYGFKSLIKSFKNNFVKFTHKIIDLSVFKTNRVKVLCYSFSCYFKNLFNA